MEWIKSSERLPEKNKQVLATDGSNYHIAIYSIGELTHDICDYSCWVKESLYWMALPEGPKDE